MGLVISLAPDASPNPSIFSSLARVGALHLTPELSHPVARQTSSGRLCGDRNRGTHCTDLERVGVV